LPPKKGFPKAPTAAEANVDPDWTSKYDFDEWEDDDIQEQPAYVQPIHPQMAKDLAESEPDMWTEIVDKDGAVIGLAHVAMAQLQKPAYNGECTAPPTKKKPKLYKKQSPMLMMVHDSMTITQPAPMPKPVPGDCVCDDCQHAFIDQIEAYEDYLDDLKHFEEVTAQIKLDALKAEVLDKQQTLAEKKKIAEEYLKQEAAKNATKKPGNPLLVVKPYESGQQFGGGIQKATSTPGTSHHKGGKFGGVSLYNDADVYQARAYMNSVLGIESMSVNGRALEHILAEVYGFAKSDSETEISTLKSKQKLQDGLESQIIQLKTTLGKVTEKLEEAEKNLQEHAKFVEVAKKMDKEAVAKTSTGRRIKE
jgi:hypothetical protein